MTRSPLAAPLAILLTALAGCAGPAVVAASGPAGPDALGCALDESTARGYVVDQAEAGVFVRVRKPQRVWGAYSDTTLDVLTASVGRRLTVSATAVESTADGENVDEPSRRAREDAQAIVAACTG